LGVGGKVRDDLGRWLAAACSESGPSIKTCRHLVATICALF